MRNFKRIIVVVFSMFLVFLSSSTGPRVIRAEENVVSEDPLDNRASGDVSPGFYGENEDAWTGADAINEDPETDDTAQNGTVTSISEVTSGLVNSTQLSSSIILNDSLSGSSLSHNSRFNSYVKSVGIDVSDHQSTIDWASVAASGVQFAIIRVGYRGYVTGRVLPDAQYKRNIEQAKKYGIKVGVYFFSMAVTEAEAAEEANFVLNCVSGYSLDLPIYIDTEFSGESTDRLLNANLSKTEMTNIVLSFCNTCYSGGYMSGEYANKAFLTNNIYADTITSQGYKIWLAHWASSTDYTGDYSVWQHCGTDGGVTVNGIDGVVDCNIWYKSPSEAGTKDGVDYSAVYDYNYYILANPDVKAAYGNDDVGTLNHFITCGMNEGRTASATFDVHSYYNQYPDLRRAFGTNWKSYYLHYMTCGKSEGRIATGVTTIQGAVTVTMYRLYNPNSGEHLYTKDVSEKNNLASIGWNYEGIGWYSPDISNTPVYRMYNPNSGDHHYTKDESEKNHLVSIGWNYEGIGWYSCDTNDVPVYRQFNPNVSVGTHNYTIDITENDHLASIGWRAEGIGWYGCN